MFTEKVWNIFKLLMAMYLQLKFELILPNYIIIKQKQTIKRNFYFWS